MSESESPACALAAVLTCQGTHERLLEIGEKLESFGWRATFFVDPARVGLPGAAAREDLKRLEELGHEIGLDARHDDAVDSAGRALGALLGGEPRAVLLADPSRVPAVPPAMPACAAIADPSAPDAPGVRRPAGFATDSLDALRAAWDRAQAEGGVFHLHLDADAVAEDYELWAQMECVIAWFCDHRGVRYIPFSALS